MEKKRIDTGVRKLDTKLNRSFGGANYDESSDTELFLQVAGSQKSLRQRPNSAKQASDHLNPKQSKSPRRPKSANPKVNAILTANEYTEEKPFHLPFPPEEGVPKYIDQRQKKLFSSVVKEDKSQTFTSQNETCTSVETSMAVEASENVVSTSDDSDKVIEENNLAEDPVSLVAKHEELGEEQDENKTDENFFVTGGNIQQEETEPIEVSEQTETLDEENLKEKEVSEEAEGNNIETKNEVTEGDAIAEPDAFDKKEAEQSKKNSIIEDASLAAEVINDIDDDGVRETTNGITTDENNPEKAVENMVGAEYQEEDEVKEGMDDNEIDEAKSDKDDATEQPVIDSSNATENVSGQNVEDLSLNLEQEADDDNKTNFTEQNKTIDDEEFFNEEKKSETRASSKSVTFKEEAEIRAIERINYDSLDEPIESSYNKEDEEDEAEDERGGYFDTPRSDDDF